MASVGYTHVEGAHKGTNEIRQVDNKCFTYLFFISFIKKNILNYFFQLLFVSFILHYDMTNWKNRGQPKQIFYKLGTWHHRRYVCQERNSTEEKQRRTVIFRNQKLRLPSKWILILLYILFIIYYSICMHLS